MVLLHSELSYYCTQTWAIIGFEKATYMNIHHDGHSPQKSDLHMTSH